MSTRTVSCLFLGLNDGSAAMGFKVKPLTHGRPTFSPSCSFLCLSVDTQRRRRRKLVSIYYTLQVTTVLLRKYICTIFSPLFPFQLSACLPFWVGSIYYVDIRDRPKKKRGETDRPLIVKKKTLSSPCAEFRRHFLFFCLVSSGDIF